MLKSDDVITATKFAAGSEQSRRVTNYSGETVRSGCTRRLILGHDHSLAFCYGDNTNP